MSKAIFLAKDYDFCQKNTIFVAYKYNKVYIWKLKT